MTQSPNNPSDLEPPVNPADRFANREISWLRFNDRVLHQALDDRNALLDRLFFLGIFTSNLDEFFMKRVGGLKRQVATNTRSRSLDGLTASQQLQTIREHVLPMLETQAGCFQSLMPQLEQAGIHLRAWTDFTPDQQKNAMDYFQREVFPVLTPLAVDPGHPFPFISNLSLSLGVTLTHPQKEEKLFARVKVPESLPGWIQIKSDDDQAFHFVSLQEMIHANLAQLFPQMKILKVMPFRITRNADIERDEEDAEDLLEMMERELRARRFANAVRLEHGPDPDPWMLRFLMEELGLGEDDVYELSGALDYTDLKSVVALDLPDLKAKPWAAVVPPLLADPDRDIFSVLRDQDVLVHHPFESFAASVERFIEEAAKDPQVLAIKMTLYRTAADSHFVNMLIRAAEAGKQVVCLLELKARFDEQRNIDWSHRLEDAGVHVVYGMVGYKTHSKTALVVRKEPDGIRAYTHIGTGNYHSVTAKLYTDFGLLTADQTITADVIQLFNHLTGRSGQQAYQKLLVAPVNMKQRFIEMIQREIEHAQAGGQGHIVAKMNSLQDPQIIEALYRASSVGVEIDLIVRGFCSLRAGVPGLSQNIRVCSVIGRFLEHSRVFYFQNGAEQKVDGEFYIGSADWMSRNLHRRVEAIVPIEDPALKIILWHTLETLLHDHLQCWVMNLDGTYTQRQPEGHSSPADIGTHQALMDLAMASRPIEEE